MLFGFQFLPVLYTTGGGFCRDQTLASVYHLNLRFLFENGYYGGMGLVLSGYEKRGNKKQQFFEIAG